MALPSRDLLTAPAAAYAQLQVATITGTVADLQGRPAPGAQLKLADPFGTIVATARTDASGAFRISDVVPGAYTVFVDISGARVVSRPLVVRGSLPVELALRAGPTLHEDVVVRGDAGSNTVEDPSTIAGDTVRRSAEPLPSQRVQAALSGLRGWSAEDNGLLHVRGVDDGLAYVQDGIPVYEDRQRSTRRSSTS